MEPGDIAGTVFDRVMDFCTKIKIYDNTLECMVNHAPEQLSVFMDSYLEDEDQDINEAIENSDWEAIEKEYENLWKERVSIDISDSLGDIILSSIAGNIMRQDELDDASKVRYLKAYDEVLDKFGDAIKHALQDSKPLSPAVLYDWYMKIGDSSLVKGSVYNKVVSYFVNFYEMLDDNDQLKVLSNLLDYIGNVLYDIEEKYMPDFGVLTNNS